MSTILITFYLERSLAQYGKVSIWDLRVKAERTKLISSLSYGF